jgi:hypothetical protein
MPQHLTGVDRVPVLQLANATEHRGITQVPDLTLTIGWRSVAGGYRNDDIRRTRRYA